MGYARSIARTQVKGCLLSISENEYGKRALYGKYPSIHRLRRDFKYGRCRRCQNSMKVCVCGY